MGICYSTERKTEWGSGNNKADSKLKKSSSGDFATCISKLGGAGGAAAERTLQQIPGRLFSNGASPIASLYTQQGKKGTNQDAMIFWENFYSGSDTNATFCGVFDGHGPYGHMVARKVRDALPILIRSEWESKPERTDPNQVVVVHENGDPEGMMRPDEFVDGDGSETDEIEKIPETHIQLKKSILKAFRLMDKELKLHPAIDCFCSGTTAVALIKQGQDLIIGNVGDSRAVLATRDSTDSNALMAVQLTVDLKPNLPREAARIHKCKGRVFALQDEPEVARVWLPNSDSPGLAMARAFGDFCLKDFGLISIPDVYHHHISETDEFVILATDGVWDVLSNKEAVDIVSSAPSRGTAARALVDCATRAWRLKYPTSKNDDCAVVCLFLENISSASDLPKLQNAASGIPEEEKKVPEEEKKVPGNNRAGERVAVDPRKLHPADFVWWKASKPSEPSWDSPWGSGRPGWHIECSAMSSYHLTSKFDIHGGGIDLAFPHHENELTQSTAACQESKISYWMHNGHVENNGDKMSKSLGNFFTIRQVVEQYHPLALRYFLMSAHYRSPLNYTVTQLENASDSIFNIYQALLYSEEALSLFRDVSLKDGDGKSEDKTPVVTVRDDFVSQLSNDLKTAHLFTKGAFQEALKYIKHATGKLLKEEQEKRPKEIGKEDSVQEGEKKQLQLSLVESLGETVKEIRSALDLVGLLSDHSYAEVVQQLKEKAMKRAGVTEIELSRLIEERAMARKNNDRVKSDKMREDLENKGIYLMDEGELTVWRPRPPKVAPNLRPLT